MENVPYKNFIKNECIISANIKHQVAQCFVIEYECIIIIVLISNIK